MPQVELLSVFFYMSHKTYCMLRAEIYGQGTDRRFLLYVAPVSLGDKHTNNTGNQS